MPRRKAGTLLPLEVDILELALQMRRSGTRELHGFGIANALREERGARTLTSHGTLYKALARLEDFGLLRSRWEDGAGVEGRPRRRLYELTGDGVAAVERLLADRPAGAAGRVEAAPA